MKTMRMIKFYVGVTLESSTLMSFTPDEGQSDKALAKGLKAETGDRGVTISSPTAECLVPWNNVAFINYRVTADSEPAKKSK